MHFKKSISSSSIPTAMNIALVIIALLVVFSFGIRTISSDTWWTNLANGRLMSEQGGVSRQDQLSFSKAGADTVNTTWLYDRMMYTLWNLSGPGGVTIAHALIVPLAFLILIPVCRRWSSFPAISLSLILCAWLLSFRFNLSPAIFTIIFPSIFVALLYSRLKPVYLWTVLPLAQLLWTNMFSSFLLGPVLVLLMALQTYFDRDDRKPGTVSPKTYMGVAGLCILATIINPYGLKLHSHIFALWNDPALAYTTQWVSPFASQFTQGTSSTLLVTTLVIGVLGLITYRNKLPIMPTVVVVLAGFLSIQSMQFIDILSILAFPFICLAMQASIEAVGGIQMSLMRSNGEDHTMEYAAAALAALIGLISLWQVASNRYYSHTGSGSSFGVGVEKSCLPIAASAVMARPDFPERSLNLPVDGGYLAWSNPKDRIFVDNRAELFGKDLYKSLNLALLGDQETWSELEQKYDFDAVILPCSVSNGGMMFKNMHSKKDWKLIFFDGTSAIFIRNKPEYVQLLNDADLRASGIALLQDERDKYAKRIEHGGWQPNSARLIGAGNVFFATGRLKSACSLFDLIQQGSPRMITAWLLSGIARARMGDDYETSAKMLRHACAMNPKLALGWMWLSNTLDKMDRLPEALTAYENGIELDPDLAKSFKRPGAGR